MIDRVREVAIVSPALRFAMIADRAEVALTRLVERIDLRDDDRRALGNVKELVEQAVKGKTLQTSERRTEYAPEAICAFEATTSASAKAEMDSPDFLEALPESLKILAKDCSLEGGFDLTKLRDFFHHLAEWCLDQDVAPIERDEFSTGG